MAHGIDLITARRETEAIAYLEAQDREHPNRVEILYALGEARWHGQQLEAGAATLERAFLRDPRWQVALHHVAEFRLARGETTKLTAVAAALRANDAAAGAALDCKIAFANRDSAGAAEIAGTALERVEKIPELYICLAQAQVMEHKLVVATTTAKAAFDLWPIDLREWGGFAQYAETLLYRGKLDDYLALVRGKPSRQRALALMMWRPEAETDETQPAGPGMRMPPLGAATWVLQEGLHGRDTVAVYGSYPEAEVREWGLGMWAEKAGDLGAAITHYKRALEVPSKGDMRMLLSHALARVLQHGGDPAGARAACEEILAPRMYQSYRAIVLPDCLVWSGRGKELLDVWRGFDHPAVVEARRLKE
jgi:tetratricopeptide (TPR) repeat protein